MTRELAQSRLVQALRIALAGTLVLTGNAFAASASVGVNASVMAPVEVSADKSLDFGSFSVSGSGQVVIGPDGSRSWSGSVNPAGQGASGPAALKISGNGGFAYSIQLPPSIQLKTAAPGANSTMQVDAFSLSAGGTPLPPSGNGFIGKLDASGVQTLNLGARLNVSAGQAAGLYSGNCNVTVDYQ